jgi:hypothetical protein
MTQSQVMRATAQDDSIQARTFTRPQAAAYIAAHYFPCSGRTLAKFASLGTGPAYRRVGRSIVLYSIEDLDAWAKARLSPPIVRARDLKAPAREARP